MPSVDEVARSAKDNLRSSLNITHNLTLSSSSPSDFVLNRMNDVLRAVIDTNFGTPSMDSVGALYAAIGDAQPHMGINTLDLALVNFSRTFAVVLEEAIKMKGKPTGSTDNNNNNNNNNTSGTSGGARSNAAQSSGIETQQASNGSYGRPPMTSQTAVAAQPLKGFGHQLSKMTTTRGATRAAAPISAAEIARRKEKEEKKDYSPDAIEGRVTVLKIPITVTELQLRRHFEKFGEIVELSYPIKNGRRSGFALLKFKDNETADEVCGHLNGTSSLGGSPLVVIRAKYWFRKNPAPVFGTGRANSGSGPGFPSGTKLACASSSLEGTISEFSVPAPLSHEPSVESLAGNSDLIDLRSASDGKVFHAEGSDEGGSDPGIC